ncbi:TIR domain-containing protein [Burkholderia vietnamiensis]|uniref:TIR domain-containing protein n=1 Tax=Burkholderia vietnamiensis TaxID=60552 RepID=UPI001CF3814A|nr:TIR domain-containing protein [Burkholderia vietnamiensis]HDR9126458.1 TIR domain-containing protein [Burkholderia vietnamiensis]
MVYPSYGLADLLYQPPKRRCFISYHHADEIAVRHFIATFATAGQVFTARALGVEMESDIINSSDTDYVLRKIRERYLASTSVTIVMIGRCTQSRRYVDWEIAASLRSMPGGPPNGLLGIRLPTWLVGDGYPDRLNANLLPPPVRPGQECYARVIHYPTSSLELSGAIEATYQRRESLPHLINNSSPRLLYNRQCV